MRHSPVDEYAKRSAFYHLDPRAKVLGVFVFVVVAALLTEIVALAAALSFVVTINLLSGVPLEHTAKRYLIALPFILFPALSMYLTADLLSSVSMFVRISACVFALILLSCTTPFLELLEALRRLKVPRLFVVLLMFTYRYFFLFVEELRRMRNARKARGFGGGKHLFDKRGMRIISYTAGMVLVRSYERSVRIYEALLARGYDGSIRTLRTVRVGFREAVFFSSFILISALFLYLDRAVVF